MRNILPRMIINPVSAAAPGPVPRASSIPPPLPARARAAPRPQPKLEHLVDEDAAARFCLEEMHRSTPCRLSMFHRFDARREVFVIIEARGETSTTVRHLHHSVDDPLLRVAMPLENPFDWCDLTRSPVLRLRRFTKLVRVRTVLVCPIVGAAGWLGAIELVDPFVDRAFRTDDSVAAKRVTGAFARWLAART